jgi:EAL domain-containing protein (putative c-di-GMP-specific phosphodiesterase class I)
MMLEGNLARQLTTFGRRKAAPRACVAETKKHLRAFLSQVLEDLGFVTSECAGTSGLGRVLETELPDLVLICLSADRTEAGRILEVLVNHKFRGKVLAVGARDSVILKAVQQVGEENGIVMLPPLTTPFAAATLRERISMLLPDARTPGPAVEIAEALRAGWLELWYQHKIEARSLVRRGAEALVRMRHPSWGVVPPAYFIPENDDPYSLRLSEFVIDRAIADWRYLFDQHSETAISITLPAAFLHEREAVRALYRHIPAHPAFARLLVEIRSTDFIGHRDLVIEFAREARFHNIAVSIDGLGPDWPALGERCLPFTEFKVDRRFVTGCADDPAKRTVCRGVAALAKACGAESVAVGVESRADLVAVNEMGFDLVQGHVFGKPMPLKKFARAAQAAPVMAL